MDKEIEERIRKLLKVLDVSLENGRMDNITVVTLSVTNLTAALYNLKEGEEDGKGEEWKKP